MKEILEQLKEITGNKQISYESINLKDLIETLRKITTNPNFEEEEEDDTNLDEEQTSTVASGTIPNQALGTVLSQNNRKQTKKSKREEK